MAKRQLFLTMTAFALMLCLCTGAFAVQQYLGDVSSNFNLITVSTLKYDPYPVEPGKYFDLWLKVENTGTDTAMRSDVLFVLEPKYPFSLDGSDTANRTITDLEAGQTALLHYKVRVANDAVEGSNPLFYTAMIDGRRDSANVNIWVQTIDANIAVNSIKAESISPGEESPVTIELQNLADSPMSNINVKLDLTGTATPFVPINSTSEKKLFVLQPKETESLVFDLMPLPDADSGAYKIPIEITFTDGTGQNYTKDSIIGLVVGAKPDILITVAKSNIYSDTSSQGTITLQFTNKGVTNLKLASATLEDSKDYDILSENKIYLGKLDSDDYATADFIVNIKKYYSGNAKLNITLEYMDANNMKYTEQRIVDVKVVSAQELGVKGSNPLVNVILIAILLVIGFFIYKRWEKKKLAKK